MATTFPESGNGNGNDRNTYFLIEANSVSGNNSPPSEPEGNLITVSSLGETVPNFSRAAGPPA